MSEPEVQLIRKIRSHFVVNLLKRYCRVREQGDSGVAGEGAGSRKFGNYSK